MEGHIENFIAVGGLHINLVCLDYSFQRTIRKYELMIITMCFVNWIYMQSDRLTGNAVLIRDVNDYLISNGSNRSWSHKNWFNIRRFQSITRSKTSKFCEHVRAYGLHNILWQPAGRSLPTPGLAANHFVSSAADLQHALDRQAFHASGKVLELCL